MTDVAHMCSSQYVSGWKCGQPCRFRASAIVLVGFGFPVLVCGYHARAWADRVVYPLDWNLARIRAWRLDNIDKLPVMPAPTTGMTGGPP